MMKLASLPVLLFNHANDLALEHKTFGQGAHGRSLLPDWVAGQEQPARPIVADQPKNPYYEARRVFVDGDWKLHHLPDSGTYRLYDVRGGIERGDSVAESRPEELARIKAAYERFVALELKPVPPVRFGGDHVEDMPLPE
jgi:hypothetical protein